MWKKECAKNWTAHSYVILRSTLLVLQTIIQSVGWMVQHTVTGVTQLSSRCRYQRLQINAVLPRFSVRENVPVVQKMSSLQCVELMVRHIETHALPPDMEEVFSVLGSVHVI